jgi:SAM-dependent methyltransferase
MHQTCVRYAPLARLNAICPYFTMFPLDFPWSHLADAQGGDWVLDPFCGRGTTNFAARLRGLPAVGVDASPVAVAIAQAKLVHVSAREVIEEARALLAGPEPVEVPQGSFWEWAYHPRTLVDLCRLREGLLAGCDAPARIALRALVLGVLHGPRRAGRPSYLSNQMPRTYATKPGPAVRFWRRRGLRPPHVDVLELIAARAQYTLAELPPPVEGTVVLGDSRDPHAIPAVPGGYAWVITSPPYHGMRSYNSDQWLRLWFLGGPPTVHYDRTGQVRHRQQEYVDDLARVWRNVAARCRPGARLAVRFGCIPTCARDPVALLLSTLERSGAPWQILSVQDAGAPPRGRRQAEQFGRPRGPVAEIDVVARLAS